MATKRRETQAYRNYIISYNAMYHDHGMTDDAIEAYLGPEPVRYVDELPAADDALVEADYDQTMVAAAGRWGYS